MSNQTQPNRFRHIRSIILICLLLLGCTAVALSGYLFYKAENNVKNPPPLSGLASLYNSTGLEHYYANADISTGVIQIPKDFQWIFG